MSTETDPDLLYALEADDTFPTIVAEVRALRAALARVTALHDDPKKWRWCYGRQVLLRDDLGAALLPLCTDQPCADCEKDRAIGLGCAPDCPHDHEHDESATFGMGLSGVGIVYPEAAGTPKPTEHTLKCATDIYGPCGCDMSAGTDTTTKEQP